MKNYCYCSLILLFWGATNLVAQTSLEKGMAKHGVDMNLPSFLNVSENTEKIYVTQINEKNPIPEIAQQSGSRTSSSDTFFKALFGRINSILTYKNGECVVIVYTFPGMGSNNYGQVIRDSTKLFTFRNISFERIKYNFKYGLPNNYPSELEANELYSMLTHYPHDKAKKMFNANALVSFPLNLRGNTYKNKYTRGITVIAGKNRRQFYLYFMMTDKSVLNFEKYLNDFEKVFWFNN